MTSYKPSDWIQASVENDQVSVFEIERQIHGQNITVSMLLYLLNRHAVNCFLYLLKNYPKKVYKCRSPEEWLFTVCRHAREDTAIPIIRQIEFEMPGIVTNTRDPWGNTLLWNTLKNHYIVREIQNTLISLGCDPNAKNQWGLSYRIIKENTL